MLAEGKLMSKSLICTKVLAEAVDVIALTFVLENLLSPIYARMKFRPFHQVANFSLTA